MSERSADREKRREEDSCKTEVSLPLPHVLPEKHRRTPNDCEDPGVDPGPDNFVAPPGFTPPAEEAPDLPDALPVGSDFTSVECNSRGLVYYPFYSGEDVVNATGPQIGDLISDGTSQGRVVRINNVGIGDWSIGNGAGYIVVDHEGDSVFSDASVATSGPSSITIIYDPSSLGGAMATLPVHQIAVGNPSTTPQNDFVQNISYLDVEDITSNQLDYIASIQPFDNDTLIADLIDSFNGDAAAVERVRTLLRLTASQVIQFGGIVSQTKENQNEAAFNAALAGLECLFQNRETTRDCGSLGLPDALNTGDPFYVEVGGNYSHTVAAGVSPSIISPVEADSQATILAESMLVCLYANERVAASCMTQGSDSGFYNLFPSSAIGGEATLTDLVVTDNPAKDLPYPETTQTRRVGRVVVCPYDTEVECDLDSFAFDLADHDAVPDASAPAVVDGLRFLGADYLFISTVSQQDANNQAIAFAETQLECFYVNDRRAWGCRDQLDIAPRDSNELSAPPVYATVLNDEFAYEKEGHEVISFAAQSVFPVTPERQIHYLGQGATRFPIERIDLLSGTWSIGSAIGNIVLSEQTAFSLGAIVDIFDSAVGGTTLGSVMITTEPSRDTQTAIPNIRPGLGPVHWLAEDPKLSITPAGDLISRESQQDVNDLALNLAQSRVDCYWGNDADALECGNRYVIEIAKTPTEEITDRQEYLAVQYPSLAAFIKSTATYQDALDGGATVYEAMSLADIQRPGEPISGSSVYNPEDLDPAAANPSPLEAYLRKYLDDAFSSTGGYLSPSAEFVRLWRFEPEDAGGSNLGANRFTSYISKEDANQQALDFISLTLDCTYCNHMVVPDCATDYGDGTPPYVTPMAPGGDEFPEGSAWRPADPNSYTPPQSPPPGGKSDLIDDYSPSLSATQGIEDGVVCSSDPINSQTQANAISELPKRDKTDDGTIDCEYSNDEIRLSCDGNTTSDGKHSFTPTGYIPNSMGDITDRRNFLSTLSYPRPDSNTIAASGTTTDVDGFVVGDGVHLKNLVPGASGNWAGDGGQVVVAPGTIIIRSSDFTGDTRTGKQIANQAAYELGLALLNCIWDSAPAQILCGFLYASSSDIETTGPTPSFNFRSSAVSIGGSDYFVNPITGVAEMTSLLNPVNGLGSGKDASNIGYSNKRPGGAGTIPYYDTVLDECINSEIGVIPAYVTARRGVFQSSISAAFANADRNDFIDLQLDCSYGNICHKYSCCDPATPGGANWEQTRCKDGLETTGNFLSCIDATSQNLPPLTGSGGQEPQVVKTETGSIVSPPPLLVSEDTFLTSDATSQNAANSLADNYAFATLSCQFRNDGMVKYCAFWFDYASINPSLAYRREQQIAAYVEENTVTSTTSKLDANNLACQLLVADFSQKSANTVWNCEGNVIDSVEAKGRSINAAIEGTNMAIDITGLGISSSEIEIGDAIIDAYINLELDNHKWYKNAWE